ncbi:TauD/TfdA family dioxygenase [Lusitaniella coriacea LEGE 07157]|uniref:TauD/TfdA family dioxygenase n=1 Tax=Lusitaniella coriacea LEGE 07157 TaxID=945747 RepID=A0A8J7IT08_9CYAN|nr:TauD/TfdA family dioxygenase [Lusitaniella coriacea]MBE9116537.1 TauD/TfdA family dioxygenase [Lusitaniella coriacea LEGE 07157]
MKWLNSIQNKKRLYRTYRDKKWSNSHKAVLVQNISKIENEIAIKKISASFGNVSRSDVFSPEKEIDDYIHKVQVQKQHKKDSDGFLILSTTHLPFDCHTDGYFDLNPIDIVILQCVTPDKYGGDSIIVFLEDVISKLDLDIIKILKQPIFPARCGKVSILTENENDFSIRYNRLELNRGAILYNVKLSLLQVEALDRLNSAIESSKIYLKLMPYDCLIIDNKRVLHGRTALSSENSHRLFRRVQIYL